MSDRSQSLPERLRHDVVGSIVGLAAEAAALLALLGLLTLVAWLVLLIT